MSDQDFPQALVDERAKELESLDAFSPTPVPGLIPDYLLKCYRTLALLSLRREREALEGLRDALAKLWGRCAAVVEAEEYIAARYAPDPPKPSLAEAVERILREPKSLSIPEAEECWVVRKADVDAVREALARERAR